MLALKGKPSSALAAANLPTLNDDLAAYIGVIGQLLEDGKVVPNKVEVVEKGGFEGVQEAVDLQRKGAAAGKKIVIKLQEEWTIGPPRARPSSPLIWNFAFAELAG